MLDLSETIQKHSCYNAPPLANLNESLVNRQTNSRILNEYEDEGNGTGHYNSAFEWELFLFHKLISSLILLLKSEDGIARLDVARQHLSESSFSASSSSSNHNLSHQNHIHPFMQSHSFNQPTIQSQHTCKTISKRICGKTLHCWQKRDRLFGI